MLTLSVRPGIQLGSLFREHCQKLDEITAQNIFNLFYDLHLRLVFTFLAVLATNSYLALMGLRQIGNKFIVSCLVAFSPVPRHLAEYFF